MLPDNLIRAEDLTDPADHVHPVQGVLVSDVPFSPYYFERVPFLAKGIDNDLPYVEFKVNKGYDRDYYLAFVDLGSRVPRGNFHFPEDSLFRFGAKQDSPRGNVDVQKTGEYDTANGIVKISFTGADTSTAGNDDRRIPCAMDVEYPTGEKYALIEGHLVISHVKSVIDG